MRPAHRSRSLRIWLAAIPFWTPKTSTSAGHSRTPPLGRHDILEHESKYNRRTPRVSFIIRITPCMFINLCIPVYHVHILGTPKKAGNYETFRVWFNQENQEINPSDGKLSGLFHGVPEPRPQWPQCFHVFSQNLMATTAAQPGPPWAPDCSRGLLIQGRLQISLRCWIRFWIILDWWKIEGKLGGKNLKSMNHGPKSWQGTAKSLGFLNTKRISRWTTSRFSPVVYPLYPLKSWSSPGPDLLFPHWIPLKKWFMACYMSCCRVGSCRKWRVSLLSLLFLVSALIWGKSPHWGLMKHHPQVPFGDRIEPAILVPENTNDHANHGKYHKNDADFITIIVIYSER